MRVRKWSKSELAAEFTSSNFLGDIITEVESQFSRYGEVICEIRVNGMFLTEEDEAKFANSKLVDINELEIVSRHPNDLVKDSIVSTLDWIPRVRDYAVDAADQFRMGDSLAAQKAFSEVLEGCQWMTEALTLLKGTIVNLAESKDFEQKWILAEKGFGDVLAEVTTAFEKEDFSLLADAIEYDLSTSLDQWNDLLLSEKNISHRP